LAGLVNSGLNSCEKSAADNPLFTLYHQEEPHAELVVTCDDIKNKRDCDRAEPRSSLFYYIQYTKN